MKEDIIQLKEEFKRIKNMGLIKSLRKGSTGLGYTFETLLNKKEDQACMPDFKSIELKCKLGYSKTPLSLFTCTPKRHEESAIDYIFNAYSFHRYNNENDIKIFSIKAFSKYTTDVYGYSFKLQVNYFQKELILQAYYKSEYLEDVCTWSFEVLENKLKTKMSTLAIIFGYPYKRNQEVYYRYLKMEIYRLKSFLAFLSLIENDKIFIYFYLKEGKDKEGNFKIINHGICFKMRQEYIEELFTKIY